MTEPQATPQDAVPPRPPTLFEAVAKRDYEAMVQLYATAVKEKLGEDLQIRARWKNAMSRAEDPKSEEKLDEYVQHVSSRGPSRLRYRESSGHHGRGSSRRQQHSWGWQQHSHANLVGTLTVDESAIHRMMSDLDKLIANGTQKEQCAEEEEETPLKRFRKETDSYPPVLESESWKAAVEASNRRPSSTFVVYSKSGDQVPYDDSDDEEEDEVPALFDGSVANSTPPPLVGASSLAGGLGTILHLACAVDAPFALAILLVMGADAAAPHTAFRRLMVHEAACCGSWECLELLLDLGVKCASSVRDTGGGAVVVVGEPKNLFLPVLSDGHKIGSEARLKRSDDDYDQNPLSDVSFLSMLKNITEISRQVKSGKLSEMDGARTLLTKSKLPENTIKTLAKSCSFSREKDAPFAQHGYSDGHGNTALHWAAFKNETKCVSLLLQFRADPNARAHPSGWTPLHDAAYSDAADSLKLLLEAGAKVDTRANSGATPLCFAAQEDAASAVGILLLQGANLSARCCGQTRGDDHHQLGHDLPGLNQNIHHHHGRFSGYTPLHYCAHYNAWQAARMLLAHPASVDAMEIADLSDRLPIHVAVARGSSDVLRELLHGGARVETRIDENDQSVLSSPRASLPRAQSEPMSPLLMAASHRPTFASPPRPAGSTVVTPVSSPILRSMIPSRPVMSSKPWNCLSQRSIDECRDLIAQTEQNWTPIRHVLFTPADRRAVLELLRVGKRLEQMGTGIFLDLWPLVLSFCGRGWFEVPNQAQIEERNQQLLSEQASPDATDRAFMQFDLRR